MYKDYSFVLAFREIGDEQQERKIDEVILFGYTYNEYDKKEYPNIQDAQSDKKIREKTREYIEQHFPMYF